MLDVTPHMQPHSNATSVRVHSRKLKDYSRKAARQVFFSSGMEKVWRNVSTVMQGNITGCDRFWHVLMLRPGRGTGEAAQVSPAAS